MKILSRNTLAACLASGMLLINGTAAAQAITRPDGGQPIVHWAVLQAKSGTMDEMNRLSARDVAPEVANEPGTYILYGAVDKNNPNVKRVFEIYEDETAYNIHANSKGFQQYKEDRKDILEKLIILPVDPIVLEQKTSGEGNLAVLHLYVVKPTMLADFNEAITKEMKRAVAKDSGVMGLFATAEQKKSNRIHTYELFKDDDARHSYFQSAAYQKFLRKISPMLESSREFENLPGRVVLSTRGFHK